MLTGSPLDAEDRVYSEPFSHLPPVQQKAINDSELKSEKKPIRRSQNRTAFKDTRTSIPNKPEAEPAKHDLSDSPSPEHAVGPEGEGSLTQSTSLDGDGCFSWLPDDKVYQMFILV
jgi:hypothetical protein